MTMSSLECKPRTVNLTSVCFTAEHMDMKVALSEKLATLPTGFFAGVGMIADLSAYPRCDMPVLQQVKRVFAEMKLSLVGVVGAECEDEALSALGLARIPPEKSKEANATKSATTYREQVAGNVKPDTQIPTAICQPSKIVRGNVRSGQRLYAPAGDLIIIGAVGEGAEVIADGNIHILGTLRGRAFAGASGDVNAHIYVTNFAAELISIAGNYQNEEQLDYYKGGKNCLITLNKDETMLIVSL